MERPWQPAFLAAVERFPHIGRAAKAAGIERSTHYRALKGDSGYAGAFQEAWVIGVGRIRDAAIQRAVLGFDEPVIYKGEYQTYVDPKDGKKKLVTVRRFPERLLMKVLGAEIPEVYNTGRMEHTGPNGGPLQAKVEVVFVSPKKAE